MKIVIVGGVAAGASTAARARRMSEEAQIIIFERGPFISFANCGLPYHLSGTIPNREDLLVMTPEKFENWFQVDARVLQEVTSIDREKKEVHVKNNRTGESYTESYDKLVLATGSSPIQPPIPGSDDPDVYPLWTIPDMDRIKARVDQNAKRAVVVGAGFIGLETAENLRERGLEVSVVEMLPQVFPALDIEMTTPLSETLRNHGINLYLSTKVTGIHRQSTFESTSPELNIELDTGTMITADFVVLSIGVRANSELAKDANLKLGLRNTIKTNEHRQTSDPDIYAVGDVTEVTHLPTSTEASIPLAGPANRQGRIAANHILGKDGIYKGAAGTSIVKVFDLTAAATGADEQTLKDKGIDYKKIYIHPSSHASYYPGAQPLHLKLLFNDEGQILGAQCTGLAGVDKRIDVIATAMSMHGTVFQLEELDLAYAPPYGSAKDPVNFAGMVAANVLRGDSNPVYPDSIPENAFLLDVRYPEELESEPALPGAKLIPLPELRDRIEEVPQDKDIITYCKIGLRGYLAERILRQTGRQACNLSGGIRTYRAFYPQTAGKAPEQAD